MSGERMKKERPGASGFTLVEMIIAAVVLAVAVIAAAGYRYHSTMDVRKAEVQMMAVKTGLTLLESWRGQTGTPLYDPATQLTSTGITVTKIATGGPARPAAFNDELGQYRITTDNVTYYATLSSRPAVTGVSPRAMNVQIGWRLDRGPGSLASTDKVIGLTSFYTYTD